MVLLPVVAMVQSPFPLAVQTVVAPEKSERLQVTAVLLVPCTVAVYCTVLGVDGVLTDTEAGEGGVDATPTRICCWPPLPGAWAMQPAKNGRTDTAVNHDKILGKGFRTGPSDSQKGIKKECLGKEREVDSVMLILSCSIRPVNLECTLVSRRFDRVEGSIHGEYRLVAGHFFSPGIRPGKRLLSFFHAKESFFCLCH
jgi:hypothetical protein